MKNIILFDIGGTKMRVAYLSNGADFEEPKVSLTPKDYSEGIKSFLDLAKECASGREVNSILGGIAGPFDEKERSLVGSPNLKDWIGKSFKKDLESSFGAPVYIENDSAMAALGEANFGAGKDFSIVAYLTLSTGVGGARIVDGKIDRKSIGFEPGHQIIDADKTLVRGVSGIYLGNILSGKGVEKRTGKDPREITDNHFWDDMSKFLAYALNNVAVFWSPDVIVLGGSMITGDPSISIEKTESYLKEICKIFPKTPPLFKSKLGDFGGLWGALSYAQSVNSVSGLRQNSS